MKAAIAAFLLATGAAAQATPLTVPVGDSWVFNVKDGQPANARKVDASAKPPKGQLMISVRALMGTMMIVTNNSPVAYTFRAELLRNGKAVAARACTLPANAKPILEQWKDQAEAVRIGTFAATGAEGRC